MQNSAAAGSPLPAAAAAAAAGVVQPTLSMFPSPDWRPPGSSTALDSSDVLALLAAPQRCPQCIQPDVPVVVTQPLLRPLYSHFASFRIAVLIPRMLVPEEALAHLTAAWLRGLKESGIKEEDMNTPEVIMATKFGMATMLEQVLDSGRDDDWWDEYVLSWIEAILRDIKTLKSGHDVRSPPTACIVHTCLNHGAKLRMDVLDEEDRLQIPPTPFPISEELWLKYYAICHTLHNALVMAANNPWSNFCLFLLKATPLKLIEMIWEDEIDSGDDYLSAHERRWSTQIREGLETDNEADNKLGREVSAKLRAGPRLSVVLEWCRGGAFEDLQTVEMLESDKLEEETLKSAKELAYYQAQMDLTEKFAKIEQQHQDIRAEFQERHIPMAAEVAAIQELKDELERRASGLIQKNEELMRDMTNLQKAVEDLEAEKQEGLLKLQEEFEIREVVVEDIVENSGQSMVSTSTESPSDSSPVEANGIETPCTLLPSPDLEVVPSHSAALVPYIDAPLSSEAVATSSTQNAVLIRQLRREVMKNGKLGMYEGIIDSIGDYFSADFGFDYDDDDDQDESDRGRSALQSGEEEWEEEEEEIEEELTESENEELVAGGKFDEDKLQPLWNAWMESCGEIARENEILDIIEDCIFYLRRRLDLKKDEMEAGYAEEIRLAFEKDNLANGPADRMSPNERMKVMGELGCFKVQSEFRAQCLAKFESMLVRNEEGEIIHLEVQTEVEVWEEMMTARSHRFEAFSCASATYSPNDMMSTQMELLWERFHPTFADSSQIKVRVGVTTLSKTQKSASELPTVEDVSVLTEITLEGEESVMSDVDPFSIVSERIQGDPAKGKGREVILADCTCDFSKLPDTPPTSLRRKRRSKSRNSSVTPSSQSHMSPESTPVPSRSSTPNRPSTLPLTFGNPRSRSSTPLRKEISKAIPTEPTAPAVHVENKMIKPAKSVWVCIEEFHTLKPKNLGKQEPTFIPIPRSSPSKSIKTTDSPLPTLPTPSPFEALPDPTPSNGIPKTSRGTTWDYSIREANVPDHDIESDLKRLFLAAYASSLQLVHNTQLAVLVESIAPLLLLNLLVELEPGMDFVPKLIKGDLEATRLALGIVDKIVGWVTRYEFSSMCTRLAIRVCFARVVDLIREMSTGLCGNIPPLLPPPPCLCFLAHHPQLILAASLKLASSAAVPPIEYLSPLARLNHLITSSITAGKLSGPIWEGEEWKTNMDGAYKVLFGLIKTALKVVKPHGDIVLDLISAQGGGWTWEMARKHRRAMSVGITVTDEQWPLRVWETVSLKDVERGLYSNVTLHHTQAVETGRLLLNKGERERAIQAWDLALILSQGTDGMIYALRGMTYRQLSIFTDPALKKADARLRAPYYMHEALYDATIALAVDPGQAYGIKLRDACLESCRIIKKSVVKVESWTCPPGTCHGSLLESELPSESRLYQDLEASINVLFHGVLHKIRMAERSRFLTQAVIDASAVAFLAALKEGQLHKALANPTFWVRKYGKIERRVEQHDLSIAHLNAVQEIELVQGQFIQTCTDVARQIVAISGGKMPCLCALARGTGIQQLQAAYLSTSADAPHAIRLQEAILTFANDFSIQLHITGEANGFPISVHPADADVRAGFEKATEVLWKIIEKKTNMDPLVLVALPAVLDGLALFRTLSLSNLVAEESLAVVEDCRAWAVTGTISMKGEIVNVHHAMVSGDHYMKEGDFESAMASYSLATTPVISSTKALFTRACSARMLGAKNAVGERLALIVRDMTLAIGIDKGVANFWALRGKALFSQDRLPEAISDLLTAFTLDPRDTTSQRLAAQASARATKKLIHHGNYMTEPIILPPTQVLSATLGSILQPVARKTTGESLPTPVEMDADSAQAHIPPLLSFAEDITPDMTQGTGPISEGNLPLQQPSRASKIRRRGPILACPPDRHFTGISAEPENLREVDQLLLKLFLQSYYRLATLLRAKQLSDAREHMIEDFLLETPLDQIDLESVSGRNAITKHVMARFKVMIKGTLLVEHGMEAWSAGGSQVLRMLTHLTYNEQVPCICVLTRPATFRRLRRIYEDFEDECHNERMKNPRFAQTMLPFDYEDIHYFCHEAVESGTLKGPSWRSIPKYEAKVAKLAKIIVDVFQIALGSHKVENLETGWPGLASVVGGVECFGMAQRHENDLLDRQEHEVTDWTGRENTTYSGWKSLMLSGVAEKLYAAVPGGKAQLVHYMPNVYSEEQRAFFAREASARKAQAVLEKASMNWPQALQELEIATLFDPKSADLRLMSAICRSHMVASNQISETIADATIAITLAGNKASYAMYYIRMRALRSLGGTYHKEALSDYSRALETDPEATAQLQDFEGLTALYQSRLQVVKSSGVDKFAKLREKVLSLHSQMKLIEIRAGLRAS